MATNRTWYEDERGEVAACKRCTVVKPVSDFTRRADGYDIWCRDCGKEYRKARAAAKASAKVAPTMTEVTGTTTAASDYVPSSELVATWAAVQMVAKSGAPAPNMVFTGPSGCGKTEGARWMARVAGLPLYRVDASAMTDPEAWFGTREVVVEDGAPKTVYVESVFVEALRRPCVMLIDEGNRVADAVRNILLPLWDDSREVTNPLTGQNVTRHPECFIVMTGNVGLQFTGTYAVDPAFTTRALTTTFRYLEEADEVNLARSRTGCSPEMAALFVRFANETRQRAEMQEDFPPISTREVLAACALVAVGLDASVAANQVVINHASDEGGSESVKAGLQRIWLGIRPR